MAESDRRGDLIVLALPFILGSPFCAFLGWKAYNYYLDWREQHPTSTLSAPTPTTWVEIISETSLPQETTKPIELTPEPKKQKSEKPISGTCIIIGPDHPNAYSAWKQLGGPKKVIFNNLAGSDATEERIIINAPGGLPRLVHPRDEICHITNRNGFSPRISLPAPGSHPGFGTRR